MQVRLKKRRVRGLLLCSKTAGRMALFFLALLVGAAADPPRGLLDGSPQFFALTRKSVRVGAAAAASLRANASAGSVAAEAEAPLRMLVDRSWERRRVQQEVGIVRLLEVGRGWCAGGAEAARVTGRVARVQPPACGRAVEVEHGQGAHCLGYCRRGGRACGV